jgi:hypothetical protein
MLYDFIKNLEKPISNAIPTRGRIITLWMFFPFTGGSGGSNLAQNPRFLKFVGEVPQKVESGRFGVFYLNL